MKNKFKVLKIILIVLSVIAFVTISEHIRKIVDERTGNQSTPYPSMGTGKIDDKLIEEGWAFKIEDKTMNCKSNIVYVFSDKVSLYKVKGEVISFVKEIDKEINTKELKEEINSLKRDNNGYIITFNNNKTKNIPKKKNKIETLLKELNEDYGVENIMTCD